MKNEATLLSVVSSRRMRLIASLALWAAIAQGVPRPASAQTCPNPPSPAISSSQPPADVCIPSDFQGNPIAFFDDYSWRAFIAIVWPAAGGQRGVPDAAKPVGTVDGPLVFETFKADWEVFQPDGHAPSAWAEFGGVPTNPCAADLKTPGPGDFILASISKFQNLGEAGFGKLVGPLVAQNKTYVRYTTTFNQTEFNRILADQLFLRANLAKTAALPDGSIDVKTSWIDMTDIPKSGALLHPQGLAHGLDDGALLASDRRPGRDSYRSEDRVPAPMDMVVVRASRQRAAVDACQRPRHSTAGTSGDAGCQPIPFPPPETVPAPFNVDRVKPINPSTLETNAAYRSALKGTVWANYQLVMTQWPLEAGNASVSAMPQHTFPGTIGSSSAFANTTLETFEQRTVATVMHGLSQSRPLPQTKTDFLWSLEINAFPAAPSTLIASPLGAPRTTALAVTPGTEALTPAEALLEGSAVPLQP